MKPLEDQQKQEKQEVVFECEFNKEDPQVVWAKDNIDVKYALGQDRFSKKVIGNRYMLTIYETKLEDAGSYSCTVKQTKNSCNLIVTGMLRGVFFLQKLVIIFFFF